MTYEYICDKCGKRYKHSSTPHMGCLVLHPPGTCCHYGQAEIIVSNKDEPKKLIDIIPEPSLTDQGYEFRVNYKLQFRFDDGEWKDLETSG